MKTKTEKRRPTYLRSNAYIVVPKYLGHADELSVSCQRIVYVRAIVAQLSVKVHRFALRRPTAKATDSPAGRDGDANKIGDYEERRSRLLLRSLRQMPRFRERQRLASARVRQEFRKLKIGAFIVDLFEAAAAHGPRAGDGEKRGRTAVSKDAQGEETFVSCSRDGQGQSESEKKQKDA